MPYTVQNPHAYYKGRRLVKSPFPINPHRFYKRQFGTDEDGDPPPPPPPPPVGDCGYGEETDADGGRCYVKQFLLQDVLVRVRICVMPDGSMKTTHEILKNTGQGAKHGVQIVNSIDGNTEFRAVSGEYMLVGKAPRIGEDYKTFSVLHPKYGHIDQTQVEERFLNKAELVSAIAGSGTFAVALYWVWKAIMFYRNKDIGDKKRIVFRTTDRTPAINHLRNEVRLEREGLFYNFAFTLQRGDRGRKVICQRQ